MDARRTTGMLFIGVANVVIGALGAIASLVLAVGCVVVLVPSLFHAITHPWGLQQPQNQGGMLILVGLMAIARVIAAVLLIWGGVRMFDLAPMGRRLSLLAIYAWTFANVMDFVIWAPGWVFFALTAYPALVEILFLRKRWRDAFTYGPDEAPLAAATSRP